MEPIGPTQEPTAPSPSDHPAQNHDSTAEAPQEPLPTAKQDTHDEKETGPIHGPKFKPLSRDQQRDLIIEHVN